LAVLFMSIMLGMNWSYRSMNFVDGDVKAEKRGSNPRQGDGHQLPESAA
jgi:hypothetical protein